MAQIFHLCVVKMTLVELAEELFIPEDVKHFSEVLDMFFWGLTIDQNVIQVYQH